MERRRASIALSLLAIFALAACSVAPATPYIPPTPLPSPTLTPEPPTVTPDAQVATAMASDVFCEQVAPNTNLTQTIALALLHGGSTKKIEDLVRDGWFVSVHLPAAAPSKKYTDEQRVFTDKAVTVFTGKSATVGDVSAGEVACTSPNELAAEMGGPTRNHSK